MVATLTLTRTLAFARTLACADHKRSEVEGEPTISPIDKKKKKKTA
jgi:hypothetical protein